MKLKSPEQLKGLSANAEAQTFRKLAKIILLLSCHGRAITVKADTQKKSWRYINVTWRGYGRFGARLW